MPVVTLIAPEHPGSGDLASRLADDLAAALSLAAGDVVVVHVPARDPVVSGGAPVGWWPIVTVRGGDRGSAATDGDRAILTAMGSIGAMRAADVPDELLRRHAYLHVGSYFLQEALWADAASLFARARALGLTTSVDGNFDPALDWDRGILGVLEHADVLFANEQELSGISGIADPNEAVRQLLGTMPQGAAIVHKLGAAGAAVHTAEAHITAAPPPAGRIIDTVGAGDSLAAGFIAARLRGDDLHEALALAVACGTASTRAAGGTGGQADRTEAQALAALVQVTP